MISVIAAGAAGKSGETAGDEPEEDDGAGAGACGERAVRGGRRADLSGLHEQDGGVQCGRVQPPGVPHLQHQDAGPLPEERVRHLQTGSAKSE